MRMKFVGWRTAYLGATLAVAWGAFAQKPAPAEKSIKARFEVLHMMINAVQVRSLADEREIHTFIYSDQIRDRMQNMFNNGGYQYGDRVEIRYMHGSDVALNIKGKPSKPI